MLKRASVGNLWMLLAAAGIWFAEAPQLAGATLTWDPALSSGTAVGGGGSWNTGLNWWSGTQDQAWNNSNTDAALFGGISGSVLLGSAQTVNGVTFSSTGGYTVSGGSIGLAGASPAIAITTATTNTIGSVVSGTGPLSIQAGPGVLVFSASNNYTGGTTLNSGTLSIKSDSALGAAPGSAGTNITFNGGALAFTGSTNLNANRSVLLGASGGTLNVTYAASGSISSGPTVFGTRLFVPFTGNGGLAFNGGTGANIPATAPYLFTLNSLSNSYTGNTTINNATVIDDAQAPSGANILPATTVLTLTNSAVFGLYLSVTAQTFAGLAGDSSSTIGTANTGTAVTFTLKPAANKSYTYAGTIGDIKVLSSGVAGTGGAAITLTLSGQGTEVFSGTDLSSGSTNINSGTLSLLNGSLSGAGAVTVAAAGTLAGSGNINGATTVSGSIAPSLGGSLKFTKALSLNSGSTFVLQAGGGTVGTVQNVTTLTTTGSVNLVPIPTDSTTLNGANSFQFLSWTTSGPAAGVQSNWNILGSNLVSWTGGGDQMSWSDSGNWNGSNVSGGTVQAVYPGGGSSGPGYLEVDGLAVTLGLTSASSAVIKSSTAITVTGPTSPASVQSLTLGSSSGGLNTLNLSTGPLTITGAGGTVVNATGVLNLGSGTLQTTTLSIGGSVSVTPASTLLASGAAAVTSLGVLNIGTSGFAVPTLTVNSGGILTGTTAGAFAFSSANAVTVYGQLQVAADGALNGVSSSTSLAAGGQYNFTIPQSISPSLTIGPGQGLFGDLTNFTYGSTGSVALAPNATLAATAGNLPTRSQLGGAILLMPITAADTGSISVGDDGGTSIFKGVSLGSWTTVGGVPIGNGAQPVVSNGTLSFSTLPAVAFSGTISDSSTNGFSVYLNGQNVAISTSASLNTANTSMGVSFEGLGSLSFPAGGVPSGNATVYSRIGSFDASNTSGGTVANTTGNQTLITFAGSNNLMGKVLNLQNLTMNAITGVNPLLIASSGTINFLADSAMYNSGTTFTQGNFNFAPTSIYRIGLDSRLTSGASFTFQTGAMVSIAEAAVNTSLWSVPSNVDIVLSNFSNPISATGTTGIVLGDGRTLSSPWNTSAIALNLSASTAITAAPGASSIRLAGANNQTLTINGPLALGSATLVINDIPSNTLYVPANGDSDFTRQPGGSMLNGTVVLSNTTATASVVPAVYVKGGVLRLTSVGVLGSSAAVTVGASDAGAGSATLDLFGRNLSISSLAGDSTGVVTNGGSAVVLLTVSPSAASSSTFAGALKDGGSVLNLALAGSGVEVWTGSNTYTGGTSVTSGTLQLGNNSALGTGSLTANGGVVDLAGFSPTLPQLSGAAGTITNSGTSDSILNVNQSTSTVFAGSINDGITNKVALAKTATGTLALTGTSNFSGGTTLSGGVLVISNPNGLGATSGALTINAATLEVQNSVSEARNILLTNAIAAVQVDSSQVYTNSGAISGSGSLNLVGSGTFALAGTAVLGGHANSYAGTFEVDGVLTANTVNIKNSSQLSGTGTIATTDDSLYYDSTAASTFAGSITGTQTLEVDAGTLVLSGTNCFSGGTSVDSGILILTSSTAIADGSSLTVGDASAFAPAPVVPSVAASQPLTIAPVPEPGTLVLLAAGAMMLAIYRKRRHR